MKFEIGDRVKVLEADGETIVAYGEITERVFGDEYSVRIRPGKSLFVRADRLSKAF